MTDVITCIKCNRRTGFWDIPGFCLECTKGMTRERFSIPDVPVEKFPEVMRAIHQIAREDGLQVKMEVDKEETKTNA